MKRLWIWILLLLSVLAACSQEHLAPQEPVMQDGVWTGTGEGRSGTILVKITVLEHRITSIVVVSQSESPFAQDAVNGMIARALEKQAILSEVDAISGATLTSNGMIDAINMAIELSLGHGDAGKASYKDGSCGVVIVGAGGAGLTAAVQAASAEGLRVIVLEKQGIFGGNGVADIVVNGKIAGQNAAEYAK